MSHLDLTLPRLSDSSTNSSSFARLRALALSPGDDWTSTVARVVFGVVLFPHGAQHALGWFGGYGFSGAHGWMTKTLGIPGPAAAFGIVFELVAPFLLVAGLGGRLVAAMAAFYMLVAGSSHLANGFFMNWLGTAPGEGFEYHLLSATLALTVALRGSGRLSLDRLLERGRA